ncbi:MAG: LamG-like jellyroll fold domain-containing protein, partial [bacterium]|nr:LamG-like jellyroll fold domain-containing protein [bacterium]
MPILLLVWFFVLGAAAKAAVQPDHLWHFDECGGSVLKDSVGAEDLPQNSLWIVGKSQCAISQPWQAQYSIDKIFSSPLPAGELTLSFYWRNSAYPNEGRNHLYLKKADGAIMAGVRTSIYTRNLFFDGGATSTIATMPGDSDWHLITITYGRGSLAFYLDGLAKAFYPGDFTMHGLVSRLEIGGENWPVDMDELAIWPKALSAAEAAEIYQAAAPLEPYTPRPAQEKARLVHSWHFDEGAGAIAADSAGATALNPIVKWTAGKFGVGIEHTWENGYLISQELDQPIDSKDLSIDFWWKNNAYPNEGRVSLKLQNSAGVEVFGIRPSMFGGGYYFDGAAAFISNLIPGDGAWHHLALVYNSHNFYLAFYVDGVEKIRAPKVWFRQPITKLVISGENWFYGIDELAIWQGALSQQEIADYYNSGQPHGLAAPAPDPVIIVPGILGSWNISGRWQIDPIFHTYDNLMEALIAAGYKEDSLGEAKPMLFTFPYDWRQDNNLTANLLKEKIQQVKEITGASQVDIVAHSMGGLVARSYAQGSDYQNDIDQVIFLGTPHRGAVDTYLKYEGAAFTGQWVWPQKFLFQIEAALNGYFDLVDYIRVKVPTVEQLLPVYDYLKDQQPDNSYQLRPYPLNYPQNIYLEDLNSQAGVDLLKQRVKITNIVSDLGASSTLNYLRVIADPDPSDNKWQSGYPENLDNNLYSLEMGNGDDTVPLKSANSLTGVETIESVSADHTNLPTIMQKEIIKTLTGTAPDNYFNSKITSTIKRWAFFRVYSPVDFAVIAPDGKKIGKDFLNNVEINQIPDAFYSGFNSEAEFVLIPNPLDGEYKVELQGVAKGGEYTLVNSLIDGDKEISKEFTGTIAPEQEREFTVDYTAAADNPISDLAPVDTVPPVITITSPLENSQYP